MHTDEGRVCLDNQMVAVFAWISPKLGSIKSFTSPTVSLSHSSTAALTQ